jgi:N-carbamoyl-L-amino-acid hydrolase
MAMAEIGGFADPAGHRGVNRPCLSEDDRRARRLLISWAKELGLSVSVDPIANLFLRLEGSDPAAAPVLTGSHMDSQPNGGRFDGIWGVIAGLEAVQAIREAGATPRRPIEVVAWTNEEGNRFQPGAMGSAVFAGTYDLAAMLAARDQQGVTLAAALEETQRATPVPSRGAPGFPIDGYVEAHIEQGPVLEARGLTIGVVTLVQGQRRYAVEILGEEAHSGTTPRAARKDALMAAVDIIHALAPAMAQDDPADTVRFTVGRLEVHPGSPSTVPGRVNFIIDLRHPDPAVLDHRRQLIFDLIERHKGHCSVTVKKINEVPPTPFAPDVIDLVRTNAARLGLSRMDMPSGAGHDAMHIAPLCPSGMIFVPCLKGISHNEAESATPADVAAGARVLAATLVALANRESAS